MTLVVEQDRYGHVFYVDPKKQPGRARDGGKRVRIWHFPRLRSKHDLLRIFREYDVTDTDYFYDQFILEYEQPRKERGVEQKYPKEAREKLTDIEATKAEKRAHRATRDFNPNDKELVGR
jgi:hypothetical protein